MSGKQSTVRIDEESKAKLEEIAEQISIFFGIKVSRAAALKIIIEEVYESQAFSSKKNVCAD